MKAGAKLQDFAVTHLVDGRAPTRGDQLVRDWGHAAEAMASATADVSRDVVLKLYTLARLIGVGGIGTRELEMIEWIRWDMRRLAAVRPVATPAAPGSGSSA